MQPSAPELAWPKDVIEGMLREWLAATTDKIKAGTCTSTRFYSCLAQSGVNVEHTTDAQHVALGLGALLDLLQGDIGDLRALLAGISMQAFTISPTALLCSYSDCDIAAE